MALPPNRKLSPADAALQRGVALQQAGRAGEAMALYREAIRLEPGRAAAYPLLGMAQLATGDLAGAVVSFEQAIAHNPKDHRLRLQLVDLLMKSGRPEAAREANRAALAVAHETLPRLDQLADATRRAIALDPRFAEAYRTLSMMVRRSAQDGEMVAMERLYLDSALRDEERMQLGFALGRGFDDLGEWDAAHRYFAEANRLKRATIDFDVAGRLDEMAWIERLFSQVRRLPERRGDSATPILVVGLPRSGKTTIEQILMRHPKVSGAGELEALDELVTALVRKHGLDRSDARLATVPEEDWGRLGADYLAKSGAGVGRVSIDTMPANFRYIGFLRLALPGARVVHCVRDPLEHTVALFQKFFASNAYDYTYDLRDIAAYRGGYARLMAFWHRTFPGFVRDVDLEALAANPETEIRGLLEFCGLDWDTRCLVLPNVEQRLGEAAGFVTARSPAQRLAPYSAMLSPFQATAP